MQKEFKSLLKNKRANWYINTMNHKIKLHNFELSEWLIEAVYIALVYICEWKAITIFQNDYEIVFNYDKTYKL